MARNSFEFKGLLWRVVEPEFSRRPLSPIGSMITGGRFNPVGVPAIYLASDPFTGLLETSPQFDTANKAKTIVPITVNLGGIADLTDDETCDLLKIDQQKIDEPWSSDPATPSYSQSVFHTIRGNRFAGVKFRSRVNPYLFNIAIWSINDIIWLEDKASWQYNTSGVGTMTYKCLIQNLDIRAGAASRDTDYTIDDGIKELTELGPRDPRYKDLSELIIRASKACRFRIEGTPECLELTELKATIRELKAA
jgi:RES domain-containing protein